MIAHIKWLGLILIVSVPFFWKILLTNYHLEA